MVAPVPKILDPLEFAQWGWPHVTFYQEQKDIIYSIRDNDETYVPAANKMGKDFVAAFIILWFFMSRHPCRIMTTSAKDAHLDILMGELKNFIKTCKYPMTVDQGGPLRITNREIKKVVNGQLCPISFIQGTVASPDNEASLQGRHVDSSDGIPRTLFACDESSSVADFYYNMVTTWAKRMLIFGNTWPCENFFKYAVKGRPGTEDRGGDLLKPAHIRGMYRKIIRIKAEQSPNVQYGLEEQRRGIEPTNRILIPGIKTWEEYAKDRAIRTPDWQCVALDADWYEGAETKLYPTHWINRAEGLAELYVGRSRKALAIGVDTAHGGDGTSMCAVDDMGVIELICKKTPDTSVIVGDVLAFAHKHGCDTANIMFDVGGGGDVHTCNMRKAGHNVRSVAFGESASEVDRFKRRMRTTKERIEISENMYVYKNRRAEMYGIVREFLDPVNDTGFGIPARYTELRRQMAPIPLTYDGEGRMYVLSKGKNKANSQSKEPTLTELLGCSPDELDSLAIAVFAMVNKSVPKKVGVMF